MRVRPAFLCALLLAWVFAVGAEEARIRAMSSLLDLPRPQPPSFAADPSWGPWSSPAHLATIPLDGVVLMLPAWAMERPEAALGAIYEIQAAVPAFEAAWGRPIAVARVVVYPWGIEAFPHERIALASGRYFPEDGTVLVAMSFRDGPWLPSLPHELVHAADPSIPHGSNGDFDDPRAAAAMAAAQAAVRNLRGGK